MVDLVLPSDGTELCVYLRADGAANAGTNFSPDGFANYGTESRPDVDTYAGTYDYADVSADAGDVTCDDLCAVLRRRGRL